jgi:SNF2 family DNA or RNA helicase
MIFTDRSYVWPLTGSPTPTAPTDCYGIAKLINNALGKSFNNFQADTMYKPFPNSFRWLPKADGYEKARKLLTPAIRIPIDSVWQGPQLVPEMRMIELTEQQKKLISGLKKDFVIRIKSGEPISAANEAAARQKFLQISLGAVYDENHKAHYIDAMPRYSEAEQVIDETQRKVVIFVGFTSIIDLLYKKLSAHGQAVSRATKYSVDIINGAVPQKERTRIIRSFEKDDSDLRVVVCNPEATAHGINEFVAADTALWFGTTEKAELYDQGNKRIRRPGQKYPTRAVQFVSNPLEKEIFRRLENKLNLQGSLLELVEKGII